MSLMLLVSGTGFSYHAHYCGKELKAWSVFGENTECDMPAYTETACPSHEGMILRTPNNCCDDQQIQIDRVDHEANLLQADLQVDLIVIIENHGISLGNQIPTSKEYQSFTLKRPPPADRHIYMRVQSFLL
ncbi:hypothetical protein LDX50_04285 [Fulvivirga sp. 1062]|uniref:Uncharacterized protein n=2 Tax=Fulvivirga sedimenti TaxID=2879465 RepID=A0A9X1KYX4_9BACT|nr:hypothetical protein [Fulvivirga sedimenti]MCA6074071.1 hypothetical protein [Fulvivirga sedimenti]